MEGRLGNGQAGGGVVKMTALQNTMLLIAVAASAVSTSASGQDYRYGSEGPQRYGNTASFFNYDNRNDQRDVPTNGAFPGNFAANPFFAGVGAAGWLESNPQHQPYPYPSQTYYVDVHRQVVCQPTRLDEAGKPTARQRYHACLPR
jgi:hypothetical protein